MGPLTPAIYGYTEYSGFYCCGPDLTWLRGVLHFQLAKSVTRLTLTVRFGPDYSSYSTCGVRVHVEIGYVVHEVSTACSQQLGPASSRAVRVVVQTTETLAEGSKPGDATAAATVAATNKEHTCAFK